MDDRRNAELDQLRDANTRLGAGEEERAVHRLILDAATDPHRALRPEELARVVRHIGGAGFDPHARERVRGTLVGLVRPGGGQVGVRDRLPPAEVHYLRHVVAREEWPPGTDLPRYLASLQEVIDDSASRLFTSLCQGIWQCGVIRPVGSLKGPQGGDWVVVDYRLMTGHWVTAFQPAYGPAGLADPLLDSRRRQLRWLRQ